MSLKQFNGIEDCDLELGLCWLIEGVRILARANKLMSDLAM
ncbi:hypothetical protein PMIT1313_00932 [Prochlorococcus marinus str. MIT 1313]|nr:hypothetical protein PMIT1313_00932 [Prochlorococcus marinus str. MIT 1313]KZR72173.1 hypothetical protein PMIT1318_01231 [Prochlorococcus marinus str. MIT 1318]